MTRQEFDGFLYHFNLTGEQRHMILDKMEQEGMVWEKEKSAEESGISLDPLWPEGSRYASKY